MGREGHSWHWVWDSSCFSWLRLAHFSPPPIPSVEGHDMHMSHLCSLPLSTDPLVYPPLTDFHTWLPVFLASYFLLLLTSSDLFSPSFLPQPPIPSPLNGITSWITKKHPSSKRLSQSPPLRSSQHIDFTILTPKISQITSDLLVQWWVALLFHSLIFTSCSDFPYHPTLSLWSGLPCISFSII